MKAIRSLFVMTDGLDVDQFRLHVVRPTLNYMQLYSPASENLLIGTALTESRLKYLKQLGTGPARGVFQMEPATERDIWENYLKYHRSLSNNIRSLMLMGAPDFPDMIGNLYYQAAMCRVHYRRVPAALPGYDDALGMAKYWKAHYNTPLGAGTIEKALPYFQQACGD